MASAVRGWALITPRPTGPPGVTTVVNSSTMFSADSAALVVYSNTGCKIDLMMPLRITQDPKINLSGAKLINVSVHFDGIIKIHFEACPQDTTD